MNVVRRHISSAVRYSCLEVSGLLFIHKVGFVIYIFICVWLGGGVILSMVNIGVVDSSILYSKRKFPSFSHLGNSVIPGMLRKNQ